MAFHANSFYIFLYLNNIFAHCKSISFCIFEKDFFTCGPLYYPYFIYDGHDFAEESISNKMIAPAFKYMDLPFTNTY